MKPAQVLEEVTTLVAQENDEAMRNINATLESWATESECCGTQITETGFCSDCLEHAA